MAMAYLYEVTRMVNHHAPDTEPCFGQQMRDSDGHNNYERKIANQKISDRGMTSETTTTIWTGFGIPTGDYCQSGESPKEDTKAGSGGVTAGKDRILQKVRWCRNISWQ